MGPLTARWSGRGCGSGSDSGSGSGSCFGSGSGSCSECTFRRLGLGTRRHEIAVRVVGPAACTFSRAAALDADRHRVARAFVAAAIHLGPAAVKPTWSRERP